MRIYEVRDARTFPRAYASSMKEALQKRDEVDAELEKNGTLSLLSSESDPNPSGSVRMITIPTDKAGLISWLNDNLAC